MHVLFQPVGWILNSVKPEKGWLERGRLIACWWQTTWQMLPPFISLPSWRQLLGPPCHKEGHQDSRSHICQRQCQNAVLGTKLNTLSPGQRASLLTLAFTQPSSICIHCFCHARRPNPPLLDAFWTLPHLQWKISKSTKASYNSHTESLTIR